MHLLRETFWIAALGIIVLFAFFVALGAFAPGEVAVVTVLVAGLAAAWLLHTLWDSRHPSRRDPATVRARERRGF